MSGFLIDPIQFVNLIADNLRDRYESGFPVLKELIQNTDDSGASELHYGVSPGIRSSTHTLLQGPGLFFINNGQFTENDYRGIRSFGLNSKAADQASIGKFGLGMKSVFHFCEAFFFLAHDGSREYNEILNPWSSNEPGSSLHPDWDKFSESDSSLLRQQLSAITNTIRGEPNHCFILWIPLRQQRHVAKDNADSTGAIVSQYPGDDLSLLSFLNEEDIGQQIAALFPLLSNLQRCIHWHWDEKTLQPISRLEITLSQAAQRLSLAHTPITPVIEDGQSSPVMLSGNISINTSSDQKPVKLYFSGLETLFWTRALSKIHQHELWPSSYTRDDIGRERKARDKARPHSTVVFSRVFGKPSLTTAWAVFLPLDENTATESVPCTDSYAYRLTLHGYFFVDAGRRRIHKSISYSEDYTETIDSEDSLRATWNDELLKSAVLPKILPALENFYRSENLSVKAITALSEALISTSIVRTYKAEITGDSQWIYQSTRDKLQWVLQREPTDVLHIPAPPESDTTRPWKVLSGLSELADTVAIAIQHAANVIHPERLRQWSEAELLTILRSVDIKDTFKQETHLRYLVDFLQDAAGPSLKLGTVNTELRNLFRHALSTVGEKQLNQNRNMVRSLAELFDSRYCIKVDNGIPQSLLSELSKIETQVVLIPSSVYIASDAPEHLSLDEAFQLLKVLHDVLSKKHSESIQSAALSVSETLIRATNVTDRKTLIDRCRNFKLLRALNPVSDKTEAVSPAELFTARNNAVLFGYSLGNTAKARKGLSEKLAKVIPSERLLIVTRPTEELAFVSNSKSPVCDGSSVLNTLGSRTRVLGDETARAMLASSIGEARGEQQIRGLRYLIHANDKWFDSNKTLWVAGHTGNTVWSKVFGQLKNATTAHRVPDSKVLQALSPDTKEQAGIKYSAANDIARQLENENLEELDLSGFSRSDCDELLKSISNKEVWRSIPAHWTTDDIPVSGNCPHAYLVDNSLNLDSDLFRDVKLILTSDDPTLSQKQDLWLDRLDDSEIIELALGETKKTADTALQLLAALNRVYSLDQSLSPNLKEKVITAAWVPLIDGNLVSPRNVVELCNADKVITALCSEIPELASTSSLSPDFCKQIGFELCKKHFFSADNKAIERIAEFLREIPKFHIGSLPNSAEALQHANLMGGCANHGWELISSLSTKLSSGDNTSNWQIEAVVEAISKPIPLEEIVRLLNWLTHTPGLTGVELFNQYLRVFAVTDGASASVGRFKVLNQNRKWTSPDSLGWDVASVTPKHLLEKQQTAILRPVLPDTRLAQSEEVASETSELNPVDVLRDYFDPWLVRIPNPVIAMFVLLLGREDDMRLYCDELLGQHSVDWLIEQMPWKVPEGVDHERRREWLHGYTKDKALEEFFFRVSIHTGDTATITTLTNSSIKVPLKKVVDNLVVDRENFSRAEGKRGQQVTINLRTIEIHDFSDQELITLLQRSTAGVLDRVYNQRGGQFSQLWQELDKSDQVDIALARSLILENIPFYLKQLGVRDNKSLQESLSTFRKLEKREKEFAGTNEESRYRKEKRQALETLQSLIETDASVQSSLLEALQSRIEDFQYQPDSVPFELFQNADDALGQLVQIENYAGNNDGEIKHQLPEEICKLEIIANSDSLTFMHWGRAINQYGRSGFPGEEYGFDRDLENMLILAASDKSENDTGKFGLGFKSVWLLTNKPLVVSGRIATEIVGGVLPSVANDKRSQKLREYLYSAQPERRWPGTAIRLPIEPESSEAVLQKFEAMAPVLVAFSKHIKTINIIGPETLRLSATWQTQGLCGTDNLEIGEIFFKKERCKLMRLSTEVGSLLMNLSNGGFYELDKSLPSLWVTAPLHEDIYLGFALNARFDVDAGRSRLAADTTNNQSLARAFGKQIGEVLLLLSNAIDKDWHAVAEQMNLHKQTSPYALWESLWSVLLNKFITTGQTSTVRQVLEPLFQNALGPITTQCRCLPNGLPQSMAALIGNGDASIVLKGALINSDILLAIFRSDILAEVIDWRECVSENVSKWLRIVHPQRESSNNWLTTETLSSLTNKSVLAKKVDAKSANILGGTFNKEWVESNANSDQPFVKSVLDDITKFIGSCHQSTFENACGEFVKPSDLLLNNNKSEESMRWAFAPETNRLSSSYTSDGEAFFRLAREKLNAPVESMKAWVLEAGDKERQCAILVYLLRGELSVELAKAILQNGITGTWLASINEDHEYLESWSKEDKKELVYKVLKTADQIKSMGFPSDAESDFASQTAMGARECLNSIWDWWSNEKTERLRAYTTMVYPNNLTIDFSEDEFGRYDRSSWLTLFLIGHLHTVGRSRLQQHRGFIELLVREGWWDCFTAANPENRAEEWMNVLDRYVSKQSDDQTYEQWIIRFPVIYKISRYLDEYIELLLGLEMQSEVFALEQRLIPRADPEQQGGGIDAPMISKTLGFGVNFIIRELIRQQVINSQALQLHAYVPTEKTRDLLNSLGCFDLNKSLSDSPKIHKFLVEHLGEERATFGECFDIPLRMVAESGALQRELFDGELISTEYS